MYDPAEGRWGLGRIVVWGLLAGVAVVGLGPRIAEVCRPPDARYPDFSQEWLSAKNYWAGYPVYGNQTEALLRHTPESPHYAPELLKWNGHPPPSILLALPLAHLPYPDAHLAWNLLSVPLLVASLYLIAHGLAVPLRVWSVFPLVVVLLVCHPIHHHLAQGQLSILILFLITLAWVADRSGRPGWAGAALGAAAAFKLFPAFLFVYCLGAGRWRALAAGGFTFLLLNGIALAVFGPDAFQVYVRDVLPGVFPFQASWRNTSVAGLWHRMFDQLPGQRVLPLAVAPEIARGLTFASQLVLAGVAGWVARGAGSVWQQDRAFAAATVAMVLASPIAWTHYFVLLGLPVGLVWMRLPVGPARLVMWPVLVALYVPENFYALIALGPATATALLHDNSGPLAPATNLFPFAAFTYALLGLLALVLLVPAAPGSKAEPVGADDGDRIDRDRLMRRLLGNDYRAAGAAVEPAGRGP